MRTSLIVFGVIFLVLGALLYFYPSQSLGAQTSTGGQVTNSSAVFNIPIHWSYGLMIIGAIFLLLGLMLPGHVRVVQGLRGPKGSPGKVVRRRAKRVSRTSRSARLPKGTTVTTTTRIKR